MSARARHPWIGALLFAVACSASPSAIPTTVPTTPAASPSPSPTPSPSPSPSAAASPSPSPPATKKGPGTSADPRRARGGLALVASGLSSPVAIAFSPDASGRMFVAEQAGRIRVWVPGRGLLARPYLDIRGRVLSGGERGLLGIAFHPSFARNATFFVAYTDSQGDLRVSRFRAPSAASNSASTSERILLDIAHRSFSNHNGGQLAFSGGLLYVGTGDGGGAGGPGGLAQNTSSLLGKILRIDVDRSCSGRAYCIPSSNPYARGGGRGEIYALGLRNPWRFSFDRADRSLWIADVGQNSREEIDRVVTGKAGVNLGWDCREGSVNTAARYGGSYCAGRTFTPPIFEYATAGGRCAIIGGYVYRGSRMDALLRGVYVYADFCSGEIWGLSRRGGGVVNALLLDHGSSITSLGEDPRSGDIFVADVSGRVHRLSARRR